MFVRQAIQKPEGIRPVGLWIAKAEQSSIRSIWADSTSMTARRFCVWTIVPIESNLQRLTS